MKKSQLRQIIKEQVAIVLKEEQEAADAMLSINQIKKSVKQLAGSDVVQQDAVLQKLLSKYTGLLGKTE